MTHLQHRFIDTNGIRMYIVEQGESPLVILCHGWPESWYSWRHQLQALADAGCLALRVAATRYVSGTRPLKRAVQATCLD
jgi:pimeloyl-ACP methyl ester carboxylesterase